MVSQALVDLTIGFALVTGTGAGILALLMWEIFRYTLFGKALFVLTAVMSIFIIYHGILMIRPTNLLLVQILRSSIYTGLLIFIGMMIIIQREMKSSTEFS
ncbi:MAG: hypothetical protein ABEI06_03550 [Halobacteriaceae archaeon]